MNEELVERVARALCVAKGIDPDGVGYGMGMDMPEGSTYSLWQAQVKAARAIIPLVLEHAATICEAEEREFKEPSYTKTQVMGGLPEQFACRECAAAIRAVGTSDAK